MNDPIDYASGGVTFQIGTPGVLRVPPRVLRVRITGLMFDTDKAFLLPGAMNGIRRLKSVCDEHPGLQVLIVGHADARGAESYNRSLSEERARSIASFLQDDVDGWLAYYAGSRPVSRAWGTLEDQYMLSVLIADAGPYYAGTIHGTGDSGTHEAIERFQRDHRFAVDGVAGPETRRGLVAEYMALDGTSLPAGAHVDTHGCGEYHLEDPGSTPAAHRRNRRVDIFFFDAGIQPEPSNPCFAPGCSEYRQWVDAARETIDVRADDPGDDDYRVEWLSLVPASVDPAHAVLVARSDDAEETQIRGTGAEGGLRKYDIASLARAEPHLMELRANEQRIGAALRIRIDALREQLLGGDAGAAGEHFATVATAAGSVEAFGGDEDADGDYDQVTLPRAEVS